MRKELRLISIVLDLGERKLNHFRPVASAVLCRLPVQFLKVRSWVLLEFLLLLRFLV